MGYYIMLYKIYFLPLDIEAYIMLYKIDFLPLAIHVANNFYIFRHILSTKSDKKNRSEKDIAKGRNNIVKRKVKSFTPGI